MPTAITRPVAGLFSSTDASSYALTAFTPAANSLLIVMVNLSEHASSTATMQSAGGLSWVKLQGISGGDSQYIFGALVGASPVSITPTINLPSVATGCMMCVGQVTGHDPVTNTVRQSKLQSGATANAFMTFLSALLPANAYMLMYIGTLTNPTNATPPAGWTEGDDSITTAPARSGASAFRAGGLSTTGPHSFTTAASSWAVLGIEITAAVDAVVATSKRMGLLGVG